MRALLITFSLLFILAGISAGAGPKISENGNKHNFSSSNITVTFRADDTDPRGRQICIFCHTPHHASSEGPLWNRNASARTFKNFSSATLIIDDAAMKDFADYGQPTGSSRLCLSCHDGVTAIGALFSTPGNIPMFNDKDSIGYETYSSHHPVSFKYNLSVIGELNKIKPVEFKWDNSKGVKLDKADRVQCTSCHDPHQDKSDVADSTHPFWVTNNYQNVCMSCHSFAQDPWNP